jgi:hypothetical protein
MTPFVFAFHENEINLIWAILNNAQISGKDAPVLAGIFTNIQDSLREQMQNRQIQEESENAAPTVVEPEVEQPAK